MIDYGEFADWYVAISERDIDNGGETARRKFGDAEIAAPSKTRDKVRSRLAAARQARRKE